MTRIVLVEAQLHPAARTLLEQNVDGVPGAGALDSDSSIRGQIRAAIVSARWQFDGAVMDRFPALLAVGRTGIGVDNVDVKAATERGVAVVNTPDGPSVSTAEHTVSLILSLAKRHRAGTRVLEAGGSLQKEPPGIELKGKILGLIGLGRVGAAVATICRAGLGMSVIAYDPYLAKERVDALGVTAYDDLGELLRGSDFVSLHLPASSETHRLIHARTLSIMKPSAYLINCSRGSIVDEAALVDALRSGRLAGAGLDVFDPEPPSPSNPLLHMENVLATPHCASYTDDARRAMGVAAVEQVLAVLDGEKPGNLVNPEVWESAARQRRLHRA